MGLLLRTGAAVVACAFATTAAAEVINTAMDLPTGAEINLVVEKTGERSGSQTVPKMTATFRYRQAIQSTDEGYVVTQTLTGVEAPPEAQQILQEASSAVRKITFETDASLAPTKVRDRAAMLDAMFDSMKVVIARTMGADAEARAAAERVLPATRAIFDQLSDEQLAQSLLKEQIALSQFQSMEIDLSEPVNEVLEMPNPLGGAPFKQTVSVKLESYDKAAGRAVISSTEEMDPEALKANAIAMLQRLAPEQREKIAAELASAKMEMRNACRYEMDLKTGLAARSDCTRTLNALDDNGTLTHRVDRTVVTQTLKLP